MRYSIVLDKNGYVKLITHTGNRLRDVYVLNLDDYDFTDNRLNAYKLKGKELIFDENKYLEIKSSIQVKENSKEVKDLKKKLADSDYIVARAFEEVMALENPLTWIADVLKIMLKYSNKYRNVISSRKTWRDRISELEN